MTMGVPKWDVGGFGLALFFTLRLGWLMRITVATIVGLMEFSVRIALASVSPFSFWHSSPVHKTSGCCSIVYL